MSRSLADYNSEILRLYKTEGMSREDIAAKLGIPGEHVYKTVKMVYGVTEPMQEVAQPAKQAEPVKQEEPIRNEVNASGGTAPTKKKVKRQVNPEDRAKKLAKILEKRSDETFKELAALIKSESEQFTKKDKALLQLQLMYNPEYRQKYETKYGLSGVDEIIKENGMEKAIRPITKREQQAMENVMKYYTKLLETEQEQKGKKIKPLYLKEVGE